MQQAEPTRVVLHRSADSGTPCAHTSLCLYFIKLRNTSLCIFFFFENKFFPSLSPYLYVQNEKKKTHLQLCFVQWCCCTSGGEFNEGAAPKSTLWYFTAPPEAAEQRQSRFHPPVPLQCGGKLWETHPRLHPRVLHLWFLSFFSFQPQPLNTYRNFTSHSEATHKKCLSSAGHKINFVGRIALIPNKWGPEQVTCATLVPKSPLL